MPHHLDLKRTLDAYVDHMVTITIAGTTMAIQGRLYGYTAQENYSDTWGPAWKPTALVIRQGGDHDGHNREKPTVVPWHAVAMIEVAE